MAGRVRPRPTVVSQTRWRGWQTLVGGSFDQTCQVKGGKPPLSSPPHPGLCSLSMSYIYLSVCSCMCRYTCVYVRKCYWPNSALCGGTICCGPTLSWYVWVLRGGWWVLRGRWRFRITQPQIDVPLNPLALFWVLLYVRQRTVGCREMDIRNSDLHACGYNRLINARKTFIVRCLVGTLSSPDKYRELN